jgi:hypothetical protein
MSKKRTTLVSPFPAEIQNSKAFKESLHKPPVSLPDPIPEMLDTPEFNAVWNCIKTWDINVPGAYNGYCGATGNHVQAILDALAKVKK